MTIEQAAINSAVKEVDAGADDAGAFYKVTRMLARLTAAAGVRG